MLSGWVRGYRLFFGLMALAAVFYNLWYFDDPYFWNFFTNQSNLIAGFVLILGAVLFNKTRVPLWWNTIRGIGMISMLVTGIVYALLLGGLYNPFTSTEHNWASSVMHQLIPVVMLLDIIIVPLLKNTNYRTAFLYPLYPLTYLGWFLVRGSRNGWYPYDFVDHRTYSNGYVGVFTTSVGLLIVFVLIGFVIILYSRRTNN